MSVDVSELNSLFAPTFCEECYSFDEIKLKVLSSPTSATDVGQTGQLLSPPFWSFGPGIVVWRASKLLSLFIARHLPFFARRHVLELGCGAAALCGLTAATSAASVVLTDGEDNVVAKANENISLNHPTTFGLPGTRLWPMGCNLCNSVSAHRLLWGDDATLSAITSGKFGPIDIVIGADIWSALLRPYCRFTPHPLTVFGRTRYPPFSAPTAPCSGDIHVFPGSTHRVILSCHH